MDLANQIREFLKPIPAQAETARTLRTNQADEPVEGISTICARDSGSPPIQNPADQWTEDALYVYQERLGVAEDLGLDTGPGSPAEQTALREARRVMAGLPETCTSTRGQEPIDNALSAFPGARFIGFIDASEVAPVWPERPSNPAHGGLHSQRAPTDPEATR